MVKNKKKKETINVSTGIGDYMWIIFESDMMPGKTTKDGPVHASGCY